MPEKKKNSTQEVFNALAEHLPTVVSGTGGFECGWALELPTGYTKHIPRITGSKTFRDDVNARLARMFKTRLFEIHEHLDLTWEEKGISFGVGGLGGGASIFLDPVSPITRGRRYTSHNVDNVEQLAILNLAFSVYYPRLALALALCEEGKNVFQDSKPLGSHSLSTRIEFKNPLRERTRRA